MNNNIFDTDSIDISTIPDTSIDNSFDTSIDNSFDESKSDSSCVAPIFINKLDDIEMIEKIKNDKVKLEDYVRNVTTENRHFINKYNFNSLTHEDKEKLIHDTILNITTGKYIYTLIAFSYNVMIITGGISCNPL